MPLDMALGLAITGVVAAFVFGIVVGSFLNVCIYRLPREESLLVPPSHCPHCQARLRPLDLIPLLSQLALRAKCRYCRAPISWRYFIIEFTTGALFVAGWWSLALGYPDVIFHPAGWVLVGALWIFTAAMLVTFMIDLDTTYVIEPVTWIAMAAGVIFEVTRKIIDLESISTTLWGITIPYLPMAVPGMILGFLFFIAMDLFGRLIFRKPGMGLGDAFIGAAIGAMLGPYLAMLSFGVAIVLGAVVGVILMVFGALTRTPAPGAEARRAENPLQEEDDDLPQGRYMPFGPFLTASAVAIALLPEWFDITCKQLWHWYTHLFWG